MLKSRIVWIVTIVAFLSSFQARAQNIVLDLPAKFVSDTKVTATVDAKLLQNPGSYSVYVLNPGPGGNPSNPLFVYIDSK